MRRLLIISVIFGCLLNMVAAEEPQETLTGNTTLNNTTSGTRPRTLLPESIECYYSCGLLSFSADSEMSNIVVSVTNNDNCSTLLYNIADIDCVICVNLEPGCYTICCECEGSLYEGVLLI